MENNFKIRLNDYEIIEIEPNYNDGYRSKNEDVIMIAVTSDEEEGAIGLTIEQTKDIIAYLTEVVSYIEYAPKVGDLVNIKSGKFKGFSGKIYDIDEVPHEREATIEFPKTKENDVFYGYVSLCDLDIVRQ